MQAYRSKSGMQSASPLGTGCTAPRAALEVLDLCTIWPGVASPPQNLERVAESACERVPKSLTSRPMHLKALEEGSPRGPPEGDEESASSVDAVRGLVRLQHSVGGAHVVVAPPSEHGRPPPSCNRRRASCSSRFPRSRRGITSRPPRLCTVQPLGHCIPPFPPFFGSTTYILCCAVLCRHSGPVIWHGSSVRAQMLSEVCTGASHVDL